MSAPGEAPRGIVLERGRLRLDWGGSHSSLSAPLLRQHCRCADCRSLALRGPAPAPDEALTLTGAAPVGHYGLQLHFSDRHNRGIFPWAYLRELAPPVAGTPVGQLLD